MRRRPRSMPARTGSAPTRCASSCAAAAMPASGSCASRPAARSTSRRHRHRHRRLQLADVAPVRRLPRSAGAQPGARREGTRRAIETRPVPMRASATQFAMRDAPAAGRAPRRLDPARRAAGRAQRATRRRRACDRSRSIRAANAERVGAEADARRVLVARAAHPPSRTGPARLQLEAAPAPAVARRSAGGSAQRCGPGADRGLRTSSTSAAHRSAAANAERRAPAGCRWRRSARASQRAGGRAGRCAATRKRARRRQASRRRRRPQPRRQRAGHAAKAGIRRATPTRCVYAAGRPRRAARGRRRRGGLASEEAAAFGTSRWWDLDPAAVRPEAGCGPSRLALASAASRKICVRSCRRGSTAGASRHRRVDGLTRAADRRPRSDHGDRSRLRRG